METFQHRDVSYFAWKFARELTYDGTKMLRILNEINYLLFLSVRNLTAMVRLDNAKKINIAKSSQ